MARVSKIKRIYEEGVLIAKECTKCHEIKSVSEFSRDKNKTDGLQSQCKECKKQWRENNKEHRKEYGKQWRDDKVQKAIQEIHENVTNKRYPHNGIQYGIIYGVYNTITNRWYIGQTTTSFEVRYHGNFFKYKVSETSEESSKLLVEDIETYGEGSFQIHGVIDVAFSEEELDALEVYYIDKYKAYDEGYNSRRGNINGKRSYREA